MNLFMRLVVLCALLQVGVVYAQESDPFGVEAEVVSEAGALRVDFMLRVPDKHYLYAKELGVTFAGGNAELLSRPDPVPKMDPFLEEMVDVFGSDFRLSYRLSKPVPDGMSVAVAYMGCNAELCFMPQRRQFEIRTVGEGMWKIVPVSADVSAEPSVSADAKDGLFEGFVLDGRDSGYMSVDEFLAFVGRVESGTGLQRGRLELIVDEHGLWIGVLAILFLGMLLNFTPCVLPMIPVNLAIIGAGAQAGSRQRGFLLGAVYGLAIALVYGALGVAVVLTGAQFGALNASPWVNFAIGILFAGLALAMLGVFNLDFTRFQPQGIRAKSGHPFLTAALFGGVAALLAGACVAPVVISVLVLSTELYPSVGRAALLLPFVLGLGMALPWPFAGAGLAWLPKPGRWMEKVKLVFGVLILGAAVYYGYLGWTLLAPKSAVPEVDAESFWMTSPEAAVEAARRLDKPLFIDFWASWCKNCRAMDAKTLKDPAVREALGKYVRLKFQAEHLSDPETKKILDQFGIRGLPSYVVLRPE